MPGELKDTEEVQSFSQTRCCRGLRESMPLQMPGDGRTQHNLRLNIFRKNIGRGHRRGERVEISWRLRIVPCAVLLGKDRKGRSP